jgi:hypothetical protein
MKFTSDASKAEYDIRHRVVFFLSLRLEMTRCSQSDDNLSGPILEFDQAG